MGLFRDMWERAWERAPRRLKIEREGRIVLAVAFAAGFAAINTGNNLLFLSWGMILSAIVLSGVLSESTLRVLQIDVIPPGVFRVDCSSPIPMVLSNQARLTPSFAVEIHASVSHGGRISTGSGPFQLRIPPKEKRNIYAYFVPARRGQHHIDYVEASTAYPFGFFSKNRRFSRSGRVGFWVAPKRVDVADISLFIASDVGYSPAKRAGMGEDFYALRWFREGEDVRRIHWRTSARMGRPVIREMESLAGLEVMLELFVPKHHRDPGGLEWALSVFCSAAEDLLERGFMVGIRAPGTVLMPANDIRQRQNILMALARLRFDEPMPSLTVSGSVARLGVLYDVDCPPGLNAAVDVRDLVADAGA